ncbi:DegT/DnrJ/EryC1/StrS family aminotransferase [Thioalkalivibrio paradoxus]|nr:DegT/DnrJ/EryC1/StrS family aminotransferase [Thioalkalivibrio paradoxus]
MGPLFVTRPLLPPLDEFLPYLEEIWNNGWVTNAGTFHHQLEAALAKYLGVPQVSLFANGTLALMTALRAMGASGEVITTPYSFVATAHALKWSGIDPVFVDIDPDTLTLDPDLIEAAITPRTSAILPVHVYGYPCQTERIRALAERHGFKVVYDAAHAFGVRDSGGSLLRHGDLSILSFHATKPFHTFEGGAVISHDPDTKRRIDRMKNFGFVNETTVTEVGINAKMNELQAAFGLLHLRHIDAALERRSAIDAFYRMHLADLPGLQPLPPPRVETFNFGYCPVLVTEDAPIDRDTLFGILRAQGVMVRRYFYPLITEFPMYREHRGASAAALPVAQRTARNVLCLPIYPQLNENDCVRVVDSIRTALTART